ncbi:hypothetical protein LCGC14_1124500 [marine sediment metagenome]|uniref:Nuclease associated modular domain-containing protein n=1 Tax=marine sediment metagenome TaxID=412755 RepID=A0A0F9Q8S7_9ZZZZ
MPSGVYIKTEEHRKNLSRALTGRKVSDKTRKKQSEVHKGKHHSDKTKKKIGDGNRGKSVSDKTRRKIGNIHRGKIVSEETKIKISESMKGDKHPNWKGGVAFYNTIHDWIKKYFIKLRLCEICNLPEHYDKKHNMMEWSNKTGKLIRDRNNWQYVHISCHKKYDFKNDIIHEGI